MTRIFMAEYSGGKKYGSLVFAWGKLYKRDFLVKTGITFDARIRAGLANDGLFNFMLASKAKSVVGITYMGYHYRWRAESGGKRYGPDRPEAAHYILERLYEYAESQNMPDVVWKALDAYGLRHVMSALSNCYFHSENKDEYKIVVCKIKKMKSMKYYKRAIYSKNNTFLTSSQKIFQILLKQPLIFPLWIVCRLRLIRDKYRERKVTL